MHDPDAQSSQGESQEERKSAAVAGRVSFEQSAAQSIKAIDPHDNVRDSMQSLSLSQRDAQLRSNLQQIELAHAVEARQQNTVQTVVFDHHRYSKSPDGRDYAHADPRKQDTVPRSIGTDNPGRSDQAAV